MSCPGGWSRSIVRTEQYCGSGRCGSTNTRYTRTLYRCSSPGGGSGYNYWGNSQFIGCC
ncbi:hypothetical protein MM221_03640 [Salipaludibacillus sp. LMS25]|uniref:hypothetical protein n=1 Tax=Salipaludibacillus sp. LMS25 TaxID=2924031 RepID=UPI0020D1F1F7|nr:hypothetical protein [Salipaludibacillus sp. LMS25]UTR15692.1 hypothetical protein MM221_03640 [Salipaludibacillus sp. LMS25]